MMRVGTFIRLAGKTLRRNAAEALFLRSGINLTCPTDIRATLTERCNYRCVYCNHWRRERYTPEMSLAEWRAVLLSVKSFTGRFTVQFLGGEPMIVPWFFDLATFCHENGIDWGVITNGSSLNPARVKELVAAQPLNIDVSIDSRAAASHDFLRGVEGSLAKVRQGVECLVAERARLGRSFVIRLKPTVTRQTVGELTALVDWAESLPSVLVDFSPVRLVSEADIAALYPRKPEELRQLSAVVETLIQRKAQGAPIETSAAKLRAMVNHFAGSPIPHGVGQCRVGLRTIDINPSGEVNHCWKFIRIGNLRERSMKEIWQAHTRKEMVRQTVTCDQFKTTCATSCLAHRTLAQDAKRGLQFLRLRRG